MMLDNHCLVSCPEQRLSRMVDITERLVRTVRVVRTVKVVKVVRTVRVTVCRYYNDVLKGYKRIKFIAKRLIMKENERVPNKFDSLITKHYINEKK